MTLRPMASALTVPEPRDEQDDGAGWCDHGNFLPGVGRVEGAAAGVVGEGDAAGGAVRDGEGGQRPEDLP